MSKLKAYLEVAINGIRNGDKIIEAMMVSTQVKNGTCSPEAIAEILFRKAECDKCPFNSINASRDRGYKSELDFTHCTLCQCRIGGDNTKEYCLTCKCGKESWNLRNTDKQPMELNWTSFEAPQTQQ